MPFLGPLLARKFRSCSEFVSLQIGEGLFREPRARGNWPSLYCRTLALFVLQETAANSGNPTLQVHDSDGRKGETVASIGIFQAKPC